jgi:hypothetical protein
MPRKNYHLLNSAVDIVAAATNNREGRAENPARAVKHTALFGPDHARAARHGSEQDDERDRQKRVDDDEEH